MKKILFVLVIVLLVMFSYICSNYAFGGGGWNDESPFFNRGGMTGYMLEESVADDGTITLPAAIRGFGQVMTGGGAEWIQVHFTTDAVVTKVSGTTNTANTNSDGNLCVYDGGTSVVVKNRLGGATDTMIMFYFSK